MWVEPAAVSRGEQQRWVGLRAMKRLKSSVCQVENTRESGVKFERAGWVFSRWREKQQKDFSCNFLWGRRAGVWGFRSLGFFGGFFEDVWRTFLEMFFTKQESVSAQILPAAERKCWPSGLSASSAALMKPPLLLSVRSSGPEVFIFILVWSHAWIFPFFYLKSSFFTSSSAEEWWQEGWSRNKMDIFVLFHELLWICQIFTVFLNVPFTISSSHPCCGIILLHIWRTGSESALYICGI